MSRFEPSNSSDKFIDVKDFGAVGDGIADDSAAIRNAITTLQSGQTLYFPKGTYLVSQEGASNDHCIWITKSMNVVMEKGVTIQCNTNGVLCVFRVSATVNWTYGIIDGNNKVNWALLIDSGSGGGSQIYGVEGKNVTQAYVTSQSASVFIVDSVTGVSFEKCYAHDATSYPNGTSGDNPGASRGFHFVGTANVYGVNKVVDCKVNNIININGLSGAYEDEDGIVAQMSNSFTLVSRNKITNCMKRGIKFQAPGLAEHNKITSARNGTASQTKMYSAISLYSDNASTFKNDIGSDVKFGGTSSGSFDNAVIEVGYSFNNTFKHIDIKDDVVRIDSSSNVIGFTVIRIYGYPRVNIQGVKGEIDSGATLSSTNAIQIDANSTTDWTPVNISRCEFKNFSSGIYSRGALTGVIFGNIFDSLSSAGIFIDVHSFTNSAKQVLIGLNEFKNYAAYSYGINVADTGANDIICVGNLGAGWQVVNVASGVRYVDIGNVSINNGYERSMSAAPTTGTWSAGQKVWNRTPTAGGKMGWVCVTSGDFAATPPVFKAFGAIDV